MNMPSDGGSIHATCVAFGDIGLLLRGPPGAGKSDLALRLIEGGARLVADDRVVLRRAGDAIAASAPPGIAGMLEIRGVGIVRMPFCASARLALVADLVEPPSLERLPHTVWCEYLGVRIRSMPVVPFATSSVAKLRISAFSAADQDDPATGARRTRDDEE